MRNNAYRKIAQVLVAGILVAGAATLSGCSMDSPTFMTEKPVEVVEDTRHIKLETKHLDEKAIDAIANDYSYYGDGPIELVVTYNPSSRSNTARVASENAARIAAAFNRNHVTEVRTEILPLHDSASSLTLISFTSYTARPPGGCSYMEEISDVRAENYRDYKLGCTTESQLAKQIARPKDLIGKNKIDEDREGRKDANVLGNWKATVRNEPLETERPTN